MILWSVQSTIVEKPVRQTITYIKQIFTCDFFVQNCCKWVSISIFSVYKQETKVGDSHKLREKTLLLKHGKIYYWTAENAHFTHNKIINCRVKFKKGILTYLLIKPEWGQSTEMRHESVDMLKKWFYFLHWNIAKSFVSHSFHLNFQLKMYWMITS